MTIWEVWDLTKNVVVATFTTWEAAKEWMDQEWGIFASCIERKVAND